VKTNLKTAYPERPYQVAGPDTANLALTTAPLIYAFLDCMPAGFRE